jgi:deoxyribodipyrimidine photo-lyase
LSAGLTGNPATRIDVVFEGLQYDPSKSFVKLWVPELDRLPNEYVHEPWKLSPSQQVEFQLQLGIDYPAPIFPSYPAPGSKRAQQLARSSMMFTHEQLGASEG